MSMNNALIFRSQLMQQFAASARSQALPPLALLSTTSSAKKGRADNNSLVESSNNTTTSSGWHSTHPPTTQSSNRRCHRHFSSNNKNSNSPSLLMNHDSSHDSPQQKTKKHHYSSDTHNKHDDDDDNESTTTMSELAKNFQSMIMTRRTTSRFQSSSQEDHNHSIAAAVERAISCAAQAPNHYRTEPVTFKRFAKDSNTAQTLMDICFQVAMKRQNSTNLAQQKVDKWKTISSFVAVTVHPQPNQIPPPNNEDNIDDTDANDPYATLPFHPPETERQLEDYASACASVQNLLLSLHSEGFGSKWATGPIIRCRAFRDLIKCRDDELIAGLIMIGEPFSADSSMKRRRLKRSFVGDLLQNLD